MPKAKKAKSQPESKPVVPVANPKPPEPKEVEDCIHEVHFEAVVKDKELFAKATDKIEIFATSYEQAVKIFRYWVSKADGIRGHSGTFYPLAGHGDIKPLKPKVSK